jgi:hypothetical protein
MLCVAAAQFLSLIAMRWVLALALFVAWVRADHHDIAVAANDFAVIADPLHAWLNLHRVPP